MLPDYSSHCQNLLLLIGKAVYRCRILESSTLAAFKMTLPWLNDSHDVARGKGNACSICCYRTSSHLRHALGQKTPHVPEVEGFRCIDSPSRWDILPRIERTVMPVARNLISGSRSHLVILLLEFCRTIQIGPAQITQRVWDTVSLTENCLPYVPSIRPRQLRRVHLPR